MARRRKSRKKTSKNLISHAKMRLYQRYGVDATTEQIYDWVDKIKNHREGVEFIEKQTNTRTLYLIEDKYYAVYNKSLSCICTFLTPAMVETHQPVED